MKKNTIIIVLIIIVLCLTGYIVYDKVISKDNDIEPENNLQTNIKKYTQEEVENILKEQAYILYGNTSLDTIDNKEKLYLAFDLLRINYTKEDIYSGFTVEDIKKYYDNSIYSNLDIKYDDIYLYPYYNEIYFHLDNETYTFEPSAAHGGLAVYPIYSKVLNYHTEDNKYTISYQYVFSASSEGPSDRHLYYTYQDALKYYDSSLSFYTLKEMDYIDENTYEYDTDRLNKDTEDYINNNYDEIKQKLKTYNYVLEGTDSGLKITNFYID